MDEIFILTPIAFYAPLKLILKLSVTISCDKGFLNSNKYIMMCNHRTPKYHTTVSFGVNEIQLNAYKMTSG